MMALYQKLCYEEYNLCRKFHAFMKKCLIFVLCRYFGDTPYIVLNDRGIIEREIVGLISNFGTHDFGF